MTQLAVQDVTKHVGNIVTMQPYTGPVPGITSQYISVSPDNLILTALGPKPAEPEPISLV